jgi:hypothetical protein
MFDALSERLQAALADVRASGKLSEEDLDKALRAIRLALLEADVNFKVVKHFTAAVKEKALGAGCSSRSTPPAGREDRHRRAHGRHGRGRPRPGAGLERPDRDPDGRSPGLRQDDGLRQARPPPACSAVLDRLAATEAGAIGQPV